MGAAALVAVGGGAGLASADPVATGTASSFAVSANLTDQALIPPTPTASVTAPPFGEDQDNTAVPIDASPLALDGTLIATAAVHQASDLPSTLGQPASAQSVEGPYNARAVGAVESLDVLIQDSVPGGQLLHAEAVTAEAVAVCKAGQVQYSASSEVVNLQIAGQDPLSGPLDDLVTQISEALNATPLVDVVDIDVNVVTQDANGASVDALVVTLLAAAGDPPLATLRIGHAEVSGVGCGGPATQCSDTQDNDGDGKVDAADPGCHTDGNADNASSYDPTDASEAEGTQCSDAKDNDGDGKVDAADPGCHTDGNANNASSFDPTDASEADPQSALPKTAETSGALPATGTSVATGAAAALALGGLALYGVRRRLT
ncbi:MAG TPA: hypothetical protein VFV32_04545 [Acidimicrobiales bacterium]|nr:hypothetical protein [Acidimicrobiales bacterium]